MFERPLDTERSNLRLVRFDRSRAERYMLLLVISWTNIRGLVPKTQELTLGILPGRKRIVAREMCRF